MTILHKQIDSDAGVIPTASVFLTSNPLTMENFLNRLGDIKSTTAPVDIGDTSEFYLFNKDDATFLSFSHSIGWKSANQTHYELEILDPDRDFEIEFIEPYFYQRNAQYKAKRIYITYGLGKDRLNWSPGQLAYLTRIEIDVKSGGARKYIIHFGSLPSISRMASQDGWPNVDFMGQPLISTGFVGFNIDEVRNNLFGSIPKRIPGEEVIEELSPSRKVSIWRPTLEAKKQVRKTLSPLISFLDEALFLCIQRYLENITGLEGNVVVVLPSIEYTSISDTLVDYAAGFVPLGQPMALAGTDQILTNRDKSIINLINMLFKDFKNLEAGYSDRLHKAYKKHQHVHEAPVTPEVHLEGLANPRMGNVQKSDLKNWLKKNPRRQRSNLGLIKVSTSPEQIQKRGLKLRQNSNGVLAFQASNEDVKTNEDNGAVTLDWMRPLKEFQQTFTDTCKSFNYLERGPKKWNPHVHPPRMSPTKIKKSMKLGIFSDQPFQEIENYETLKLLHQNGIIADPGQRCLVWGEQNLVDLFLGKINKKHTPGLYAELEQMFSVGSELLGDSTVDSISAALLLDPTFAHKITGDYQIKKSLEKLDRSKIKEIDKSIEAIVKGEETATHLQLVEGAPLIPVLRANVRNANVLDFRMNINPHYWATLTAITHSQIINATKAEVLGDLSQTVLTTAKNILEEQLNVSKVGMDNISIIRDIYDSLSEYDKEQFVISIASLTASKIYGSPFENLSEEGIYILLETIKSYLGEGSSTIFRKINPRKIKANAMATQTHFYEKLYNMAAAQATVTTIPLFHHSAIMNLGKDMFLLAAQPTISGGIEEAVDDMSLKAKKYHEGSSKSRKRLHSSFMSGLYLLRAFEHRITKTKVDSQFRLVKTSNTVSNEEIERIMRKHKDHSLASDKMTAADYRRLHARGAGRGPDDPDRDLDAQRDRNQRELGFYLTDSEMEIADRRGWIIDRRAAVGRTGPLRVWRKKKSGSPTPFPTGSPKYRHNYDEGN